MTRGNRGEPRRQQRALIQRADTSWMEDGSCIGINDFTEMTVTEQRRVCQGCPVRLECLEFGLAGPIGVDKRGMGTVFGGVAPKALAKLQRARELAS